MADSLHPSAVRHDLPGDYRWIWSPRVPGRLKCVLGFTTAQCQDSESSDRSGAAQRGWG